MSRVMSGHGQALLDQMPFHLRGVHQIRASANAQGDEHRLLEEAVDRLVDGLFPMTADGQFLGLFESLLGLSVANPLLTLAQRRARVLASMTRLPATGSAVDWRALGDRLIGTGWTYRFHDPTDGASPAANRVTITLPFPSTDQLAPVALELFASITAATVIITYVFSDNFILDSSLLDSATGLLA